MPIGHAVTATVSGPTLHPPDALDTLPDADPPTPDAAGPVIEVTDETTQIAARRLVAAEGIDDLVLASAVSPWTRRAR